MLFVAKFQALRGNQGIFYQHTDSYFFSESKKYVNNFFTNCPKIRAKGGMKETNGKPASYIFA